MNLTFLEIMKWNINWYINYINIRARKWKINYVVYPLSCHFINFHHYFVETGNIISCSHSRSILLFTESINSPCAFRSFQCSNTREFLAGRCFGCGSLPCPTAGYNSIQYRARGKFYLATRSNTPFCGNAISFNSTNTFHVFPWIEI